MSTKNIGASIALGALSGVRSLTPSAVVARELGSRRRLFRARRKGGWLRRALEAGAFAEMLVDQAPSAPDRTSGSGLAGRVVFGAILGAVVVEESRIVGALAGGASAWVATWASFGLRSLASRRGKAMGVIGGMVEDAFVVTASRRLARAL
ncbi:MAG TPA: hypothetical protein VGH20_19320 [Myxococcales bacterium]|jgi:uncharacterized membrane protein